MDTKKFKIKRTKKIIKILKLKKLLEAKITFLGLLYGTKIGFRGDNKPCHSGYIVDFIFQENYKQVRLLCMLSFLELKRELESMKIGDISFRSY